MELEWITTQQAADKWDITVRRVQALCKNNQINGVVRLGKAWLIPKDAPKPPDSRFKKSEVGSQNENT
ncbi:MAG: helix-turn-helix domain-containing protein [Oscillospiraceae bacterium]|nr:helix-turn-helix domain-containing protein [Oscillospiraceae bacterium]